MSTPNASADPGWPRLVDAVRRTFAGSPYRVEVTPETIAVHADLADARFLSIAGARRFQAAYRTELRSKGPGTVTWEDAEHRLEWTAGFDGTLMPRLSGRVSGTRGRIATVQFRKELGVDERGPGAPVDYAFSSGEIATPLKRAVADAGFRTAMAASTKIGLVAAIVGGAGALAVGVAALIGVLVG